MESAVLKWFDSYNFSKFKLIFQVVGQQRTNFATSYNMNNSYQEFSQHQELDIHQNSNENSNFVQESDEFSSMVSQEDLNLVFKVYSSKIKWSAIP